MLVNSMKRNPLFFICIVSWGLLSLIADGGFKAIQQKSPRVKQAYKEKEKEIQKELSDNGISINQLNILLVALKQEQQLVLWAKNKTESNYKKIKTYSICASSGDLGPKRKYGDMQVPEGFYHIDRFNPNSNYHLSLGISYPNKSDKIISTAPNLGGDIFIHGNCVTIGCMPITDDKIKELYIYAVEAKNNGQEKIPVYIFPCKLSDDNMGPLQTSAHIGFWKNLKEGYDLFYSNHKELAIGVDVKGKYDFR